MPADIDIFNCKEVQRASEHILLFAQLSILTTLADVGTSVHDHPEIPLCLPQVDPADEDDFLELFDPLPNVQVPEPDDTNEEIFLPKKMF